MKKAIYIYQHKNWPTFIWDSNRISQVLANTRLKQGKLLGKIETLGFQLKQEASLETLTEEIVKSSDIEGEKLPNDQVRSSIARSLGLQVAGMVDSEKSVDGVVEMMLDATRKFKEKLTEKRLFGWHASLFPIGYSGSQKIKVGVYRDDNLGPMEVVSGAMGKRKIHFEAPPAKTIQFEMKRFLEWFNSPHKEDPVIVAAVAHLWFVTIHPFEDGNGRITRALTEMLLARSDGSDQRFYSMSSHIRKERKGYYETLEKSQKSGQDISEWILWFLESLLKAIETSEHKLIRVMKKADFWERHQNFVINERQSWMVNKLMSGTFVGNLTTSKWAKMTKCSHDTALRDLSFLEKQGMLRKEGKARATRYLINC